MTKQQRHPTIFDAPPLKEMPLLSQEAAGVIHAHLPPPNVELYIAPAMPATPAVAHSSGHAEKTKDETATKRPERKP